MEFVKAEVAVAQTVESESAVVELEALELSLVGGGMGDVVFHR
jgi:hypothetical protein